jgi:GNAT superfamily N-acetyltransferase
MLSMPKTKLDRITYRKLLPDEQSAFEAHLLALDPESRRSRFGMAANDSFLEQYAARCLTLNAIIHGAFLDDRMVGVAELRPLGVLFSGDAEIAFSVATEWRNCGIGTDLFARTLRSARNRGFSRLYMSCQRQNAPMRTLAKKFTAEILVDLGESVALVEAPRRTMISLLREAIDDVVVFSGPGREWSRLWMARRAGSPPLTRIG